MQVTRHKDDTLLVSLSAAELQELIDIDDEIREELELGETLTAYKFRSAEISFAVDMDIEDDGGQAAREEARRQMREFREEQG